MFWGWAPSLPRSVPVTAPTASALPGECQGSLGNASAAVTAGTEGTARGAVAALRAVRDRERCGAENSGGTRLFQRQKRRVKGRRVRPGRRVPWSVLEPGPEGGGGQGCWLQGHKQRRGPRAAPFPAGAGSKGEALPHELHSSPCRCSAARSAGSGGLL